MQAHRISSVVVDIAAFKVSHSVGSDIDATTALQAARVRSKSIGAMDESSGKVQDLMQAHPSRSVVMDIAAFKVSHSIDKDAAALRARSVSIGAMDESSMLCA